jgi:uridine kinase
MIRPLRSYLAMNDIKRLLAFLLAKRKEIPVERSLLAGITGIDGAGKGFVAAALVAQLQQKGLRAVVINLDGWLNLPHKRFSEENPAEHFYENAIRFAELFEQLIVPLKENRSIHLEADFAEESATEYRKHLYHFEDVDCIVLEGIYLFKPAFQHHFDFKVWVNCTFETALKRALQRAQEGLSPEATRRAYETIYFPAQRLHFLKDNPYSAADMILNNDSRIIG